MAHLSNEELVRKYTAVDPDGEPSRQAYVKFIEGKSPSEVRWWTKDTVAVVTGGNKGIGYEIARQIAKEGVTVVLTARDEKRGQDAVTALEAEGLDNVIFHALDVTDSAAASALATWAKKMFGGVDILVCNAGVAPYAGDAYKNGQLCMETNYYGSKTVITKFLPIIRPSAAGGRIVLVSSGIGQLQFVKSDDLRKELNNIDTLTFDRIDELAQKFLEDCKEGKHVEWANISTSQYSISKVLMNAYARVLVKSLSDRPEGRKIYVNLMSPGLTATDMISHIFEKYGNIGHTAEQGADTAVWIALFPAGGPTGQFLRDRADFPF